MQCPKCSAKFGATPDEIGMVECPQCGARLRSKGQAVFKARGAPAATGSVPGGTLGGQGAGAAPAHREPRRPDPDDTVPMAEVDPALLRGAPGRGGAPPGMPPGPATLATLLAEVRMVRKAQEEILAILKGESPPPDDEEPPPVPRRRRS